MMEKLDQTLPIIILVEPQLGENIGAAARIMSNFSYEELRVVAPRDGWPNDKAQSMAAHGAYILDNAKIYGSVAEAIADINFLIATSSQERHMNKDVTSSRNIRRFSERFITGRTALMFGCERVGLSNKDLQMADVIITIPVSERNPSLNLAQAVAILCYEFSDKNLRLPQASQVLARKEELEYFLNILELRLIETGFLANEKMRPTMRTNIRNIFVRAALTEQDIRTLHGIVSSLKSGR